MLKIGNGDNRGKTVKFRVTEALKRVDKIKIEFVEKSKKSHLPGHEWSTAAHQGESVCGVEAKIPHSLGTGIAKKDFSFEGFRERPVE